jgi:hypothetical protein
MNTPPRRERDENRVFNNNVRVVDPKVTRPGTSYDKNPGDRIVPRDNNESGPMVREDIAAGNRKAHDKWVENTNKQAREEGKTPVVKVNSGGGAQGPLPSKPLSNKKRKKGEGRPDMTGMEDAEIK